MSAIHMEASATSERIQELEAQVEALQRFKSWTHNFLDAQGVPHHPPGTHGAAGCRIGDRMDWLMNRLRAAESEFSKLRMEILRTHAHFRQWYSTMYPGVAVADYLRDAFDFLRRAEDAP